MKSLSAWLGYIESCHPESIELGLTRVKQVAARLGVPGRPATRWVLVGGTNGKGTTVALLETITKSNGLTTFSYTSPHVMRFNERIRCDCEPVADALLVEAFAVVETARGNVALTFFEFATLAAMWIAHEQQPDLAIFEVGLGGRLDAVNILNPDVSIVTSIGIDHTTWLGQSIDEIAHEKLGIARVDKPLLLGDDQIPSSALAEITRRGLQVHRYGREFSARCPSAEEVLVCTAGDTRRFTFDPRIHPKNLATACYCCDTLLGVTMATTAWPLACANVFIPGRFQRVDCAAAVILDVSHNAQAISHLNDLFGTLQGPLHLLVGMLSDKDIAHALAQITQPVARWASTSLSVDRGASAQRVAAAIAAECICYDSIDCALEHELTQLPVSATLVVFGSFHTVEGAARWLATNRR